MGFDHARFPARSTTTTRSQGEDVKRSSGISARVIDSPWMPLDAVPCPDTMTELAAEHSTRTTSSVISMPRISGPWLE